MRKILAALILAAVFFGNSVSEAQTKGLRVFIFAGQSNCKGAGYRANDYLDFVENNQWDSQNLYSYKLLPNIRAYSPDVPSNWITSQGDGVSNFHQFLNVHGGSGGNVGSDLQFARDTKQGLIDEGIDDDVAVIRVAAGSSHAHDWLYRTSPLFDSHLVPLIEQSMAAFEATNQYDPNKIRIRGFVWLQGESDIARAGYNANVNVAQETGEHYRYGNAFNQILTDLRISAGEPELPFVISVVKGRQRGDLNDAQWETHLKSVKITRRMQRDLALDDRFGHPLYVEGANTVDDWHWDYNAHHLFGKIIAHKIKYAGIYGENVGGDPHSHVQQTFMNEWDSSVAGWQSEVNNATSQSQKDNIADRAWEKYRYMRWYSSYVDRDQVVELFE